MYRNVFNKCRTLFLHFVRQVIDVHGLIWRDVPHSYRPISALPSLRCRRRTVTMDLQPTQVLAMKCRFLLYRHCIHG